MTETKKKDSSKGLKILIAALILICLGALYFGISNYSKLKENEQAFQTEKSIQIAELKSLERDYKELQATDSIHQEEILVAKENLQRLIDSVSQVKQVDMSLVNKLRNVRDNLKARLKQLKKENEVLKERNQQLTIEKDSISTELTNTLVVYDSVTKINKDLEAVVAKAQKLNVNKVDSKAVKIKGSNKVVEVSRAKRATGFEVCFEVLANQVADAGEKELFVQVVSPEKKVIGGRYYLTDENNRIVNFSKIAKFRYQNKTVTVCDFVEPLAQEVITKGSYAVNVFDGTKLISTTSVSLK